MTPIADAQLDRILRVLTYAAPAFMVRDIVPGALAETTDAPVGVFELADVAQAALSRISALETRLAKVEGTK